MEAALRLPAPSPGSALLLALHRDAVSCIFDFLSLAGVAALLASCHHWPARDVELANDRNPRRRPRAAVRLAQWVPGHPVWDGTSPLRHLLTAVDVHATLPSSLAQLRIALPHLRELRINIPMVPPEHLEWSLPLRLQVLDVYWQGGPDVTAALNAVAAALSHLERLTSLRLISNRNSVDCESLLDAVRAHPSITHLELRPLTLPMLTFLTRLPHTLRLHHLALPYMLPIDHECGAALAKIPSLTILESSSFCDLSCLASLRAMTQLRIRFWPDNEEDPIWEQSDADAESSLFLEHLPRLAALRRLTIQLPARLNCLRKSFVGEILFNAIHRSSFHLVELDLCDWLVKAPRLFSLLRLPALVTLQTFRHRFTVEYEGDDDTFQQLSIEGAIEATPAHPLCLPHLTELQLEHPWMTETELVALLLCTPSLTDIRLDCPRAPDIGRVSGSAALARTLARTLKTVER